MRVSGSGEHESWEQVTSFSDEVEAEVATEASIPKPESFGFRDTCFGLRDACFGFRVSGFKFRVAGCEMRVSGFGNRFT